MRLPAEWEPQSGVMLTWPHAGTDWSGRLERVYPVFAAIGAAIAAREVLLNVCQSHDHFVTVSERLRAAGADPGRLRFALAPSNDTWARDHGPLTTLGESGPLLNDFLFNGWGGKFSADLDTAITGQLCAAGTFADVDCRSRRLVLEGGAVETDGQGSLLATRSSILGVTRNPGMSQTQVEASLADWLGIQRFLWLDHGDISGDDTDGHIDTLARFADPRTILHATAPPGDADHAALDAMARELAAMRTPDGDAYRLLPLPFAGLHRDQDGRRLPATYANFLVIDGAVLVPVYGVAADAAALAVIGDAFPGRTAIGIDAREIIHQGGSLHCLTMQFPRGVALRDTLDGEPR